MCIRDRSTWGVFSLKGEKFQMFEYIMLAFGGLFLGGTAGFLYYMGAFNPVRPEKSVVHGGHIVYSEYVGNYWKIGNTFEKFGQQTKDLFQKFEGATSLGIYYDNPQMAIDKNECRAIVGVLVPPNVSIGDLRAEVNADEYKIAEVPRVESIRVFWPFRNVLSFLVLALRAYPVMERYLRENTSAKSEGKGGVAIEFYHFGQKNKQIETNMVYGPGIEKYVLTTSPPPRQKGGSKKD
eukprot:TRINITY_DN2332_c0_g1_i1.p1 TRINITY_DN2332_c0_g1~~TRINITY_DN2332_c0_g1_i1.p1  ORF type:complete len:257 (+),score=45.05 TRINITY_DN2332_c0_g1_i1:61-771(+)